MLLDYSKAFDMLDYNLLYVKLQFFGFSGVSVSFFRTYLPNCYQIVRFGDILSLEGHIVSGVPQGTIVGPLLLIYTFDIFEAAVNSHVQSYADDTCIVLTQQSRNKLGSNLTKI